MSPSYPIGRCRATRRIGRSLQYARSREMGKVLRRGLRIAARSGPSFELRRGGPHACQGRCARQRGALHTIMFPAARDASALGAALSAIRMCGQENRSCEPGEQFGFGRRTQAEHGAHGVTSRWVGLVKRTLADSGLHFNLLVAERTDMESRAAIYYRTIAT